jgi:fatty acid desaturase
MDDVRWAIRLWRWLPLLYLANAGFLLMFLSFPGNLVLALVFLVLGLGHFGAGKFVGSEDALNAH